MQIAINISHNLYESIMKGYVLSKFGEYELYKAVQDGAPLPEHHGRVIDADVACPNHTECVMCPVAVDCPICAADTIIPATEEEPVKQTKKEVDCINCSFKWNCYKHGKLVNPCDAYIEQHEQIATEGENNADSN